ncbi:hypothetical protein J437_LFUL009930 [Ladona fulva]|uniref:Uncharacterized protein n=1 Tax=Ladona fulva TaxID=123851 RepID=A0A8K0P558_LADFU|nr:hypothetical protein J437_LFUL009930 [Ladona fulva]
MFFVGRPREGRKIRRKEGVVDEGSEVTAQTIDGRETAITGEDIQLVEELSASADMPLDVGAEERFKTLHYRNEEGRYVVPILLKPSTNHLGDSETVALERLGGLERKFAKTPDLKDEYSKFFKEYARVGLMSLEQRNVRKYYIPHHAVLKASSSTRRLRVAILWRHDPHMDIPIEEFQLNTVTGLTSSPFLVMRLLQQLSHDEAENFTFAASIVARDFLVDYLVSGASSPYLAKQLMNELTSLLKAGGFQHHKSLRYCKGYLLMNASPALWKLKFSCDEELPETCVEGIDRTTSCIIES